MHPKYAESVRQIKNYAENESNVMGVILLGSQVRKEVPGDQWSDLDVLLFLQDTSRHTTTDEWLSVFGEVACICHERVELPWINLTWYVKRVLYEDNRALDFSIMPHGKIDDVLEINKEIHALGFHVLYDSTGGELHHKMEQSIRSVVRDQILEPGITEINRTVHEILFHIVNTYKKVKRGELWIATSEINCVIKENLLRMIEYHNARVSKKNNILTYEGRLLENRTDPRILRLLTHCFVSYDERSVLSGLEHVLDLTHMMYREICTAIDREADEKPIASVRKIIREMKQDA